MTLKPVTFIRFMVADNGKPPIVITRIASRIFTRIFTLRCELSCNIRLTPNPLVVPQLSAGKRPLRDYINCERIHHIPSYTRHTCLRPTPRPLYPVKPSEFSELRVSHHRHSRCSTFPVKWLLTLTMQLQVSLRPNAE